MNQAVLINGASGGIGQAGSLQLAQAGFSVYAGVLNEAEASVLESLHEGIKPVIMDATDADSVATAIDIVEQNLDGQKLFGLWNNAGIINVCAFQNLSLEEIRAIVEVNLLGAMTVIHTALPLLAHNRSRIVITGSATGMFAGPAVSVYTATKWGLEGFADALRIELGIRGIAVSLLQPGLVHSPMSEAARPGVEKLLARLSDQDKQDYGQLVNKIADVSDKASTTPEAVAAAALKALQAAKPKPRYRIGPDARAVSVLRHFPDGIKDFVQRKTFGL